MNKKIDNKIGYGIVVLIVVIGGLIYFTKNTNAPTVDITPSSIQTSIKTPSPTEVTTPALTPNSKHTTYNINIENFSFSKNSISIKKGDTVVWTNKDSAPHTVTGMNGGINSGTLGLGQSYSYTFTTAGTWSYLCHFHPSMTGKIIVQ